MEQDSPEEKVEGTPKKKGLPIWLTYAAPAVLVAVTVLIYFVFKPSDPEDVDGPKEAVEIGKDYYVYVNLVELYPVDSNGNNWDGNPSGKNAAPDVRVYVFLKGVRQYTSDVVQDRLQAMWSGLRVDPSDIIAKGLSLDNQIKVPRTSLAEGDEIVIEVKEVDPPLGLSPSLPLSNLPGIGGKIEEWTEELVQRVTISIADLKEGENAFIYNQDSSKGLKRIKLKMLRSDMPQADLTKQLILGQ
tara:strand:- start:809 stop:1540 length:732 start_codon:yes stop_codon:yes gene_type:complete